MMTWMKSIPRTQCEILLSGLVYFNVLGWGFVEDAQALKGGNAEVEPAGFLVFEGVSEGAAKACCGGDDQEEYGEVLVGSAAHAAVGEGVRREWFS